MPKLTVNGKEVEFDKGMTVLQACELAGEEIPRFCYHERLKIAGNCRMCLVQIEGGPPKPAASCAMPAAENMVVHTNTPMVKKAREGVMEFLLINHPLDCPICDQGGECDLQDQAMTYGRGLSRYDEHKRAVKEKYMGPLIKTQMTRCIHCTRCVRFIEDVAGVSELGAVGRGEHMEITTYVEKSLTSELSANIIDLCPVGALTSKPYAFKARPWELRKTESVDVMDAVGSNIRVDARGREVMRILPRLNEDVNEEWISDKTRYACDGLKMQRLDRPYVRKNGKLVAVPWEEALRTVAEKLHDLPGDKIAAIAGDQADCESMYALKEMMTKLGSPHIDCRQDGMKTGYNPRVSYLFNTTIAGIDRADFCLLIGTNPRVEAPIINARLRKAYLNNRMQVALVGEAVDLTYPAAHLGNDPKILEEIANGRHPVCEQLKAAKNPMVIIGSAALRRSDAEHLLFTASGIAEKYNAIREDWNGFNVLHHAASRVGGLDIGFLPAREGLDTDGILKACGKGEISVLYLLAADELDMSALGNTFVIYQGHHGDAGAHRADVILPGAAYTEKNATYVNTEGRVQHTTPAVFAPGDAREDWRILHDICDVMRRALPYSTLAALREYMVESCPVLAQEIQPSRWEAFGRKSKFSTEPFEQCIKNFYMTDPISRASKTMAQCVKDIVQANQPKEAA